MDSLPFIPSIKYQELVKAQCHGLHTKCHADYLVMYIAFSNGDNFVLSNTDANFLYDYYQQELFKQDFCYQNALHSTAPHIICEQDTVTITKKFQKVLAEKYHIHPNYYIVRKSAEAMIIAANHTAQPVRDKKFHFQSTYRDFEKFCVHYLLNLSQIIKAHNPSYEKSLILNNQYFIKKLFTNAYTIQEKLTDLEIEVLIWAGLGKSSEETAVIMGKTRYAIENKRRGIKEKMNVATMAQAMFEAVQSGCIGSFSAQWDTSKKVRSINAQ
jgi:DNA-binding CsgD family transcriptional regulator